MNINALVDDFEMVDDFNEVSPTFGPDSGYNYTGIPYEMEPGYYAVVCDIVIVDDTFSFSVHGCDCISGCACRVYWDIKVSENCEVTLSTEENDASSFSIYPNPVTEILYLQNLPAGYHSIKIYSLQGQLIKFNSFSSEEINVADLTTGVYFIEISTAERSKEVKRFVKK
jgi:hypothetical protein